MHKIIILLLLLQGIGLFASAQTKTIDSLIKDNEINIPPYPVVLEAAINHNAAIKFRKLDITIKNAGLNKEKTYWTKNVGVQADSRYGTFDNFSTNSTGQSTSILNATSKQLNYGVGVYLKLPFEDILNRKNMVKKANAELEQSKSMADAQEEELKLMVIKQYQELLLKQKLMHIQSLALGNAKVDMDMVEKEFRNGMIPVGEYVRVSNIVSLAQSDYEKAKSEFITSKMIMEVISGLTFDNTPTKK